MKPAAEPPYESIARLLAGEATDADRAQVKGWAERSPAHQTLLERLRQAWTPRGMLPKPTDVNEIWTAVSAAVAGQEPARAGNAAGERRTPRKGATVSAKMAGWGIASFVALALTVYVWSSRTAPVAPTVVTTGSQRTTLMLHRDTRVTLAPYSTLTMQGTEVTLSGEAFFTVTHHRAHPLIVHTGPITTSVLGTRFDVRRYAADAHTRVVVTEGRVRTGTSTRGNHGVTLIAGQVAQVTDSTVAITTVNDPATYTSWTHGRWDFSNIPVRDLLETIGPWYGLQFRVTDTTLAAEPVSVRFEGQSAADVLKILQAILNVTVTVNGHVVTMQTRVRPSGEPTRRRLQDSLVPHFQEVGR